MSARDIIVVVPRGTKVRYIESEYVHEMFVFDARALAPPTEFTSSFGGELGPFLGVPVYDAEEYTPEERTPDG